MKLLHWLYPGYWADCIQHDMKEQYDVIQSEEGSLAANGWMIIQLFHIIRGKIQNGLWQFGPMFINYLKVAFRNIIRQRIYSAINMIGLSIGLTICFFIFTWVRQELSFDRFHPDAENIFRVEREINFGTPHPQSPETQGAFGPTMTGQFPEIEEYVRIAPEEISVTDFRHVSQAQKVYFADNSIFRVFNFPLIDGDTETALVQPNSIVLTRDRALKYFGTIDAIGKPLSIDWKNEAHSFIVTGILDEIPKNSHLQFDFLLSLSSFPPDLLADWRSLFLYTYVRIADGVSPSVLDSGFESMIQKHLSKGISKFLPPGMTVNDVIKVKLKPLLDIHLYPAKRHEIEPQGSMSSVTIFSIISVFIFVLAVINFASLSTALISRRAREVGIRKTIGANRRSIVHQFLGESILEAIFASLLALILILLSLPWFNVISHSSFNPHNLFQFWNVTVLGIGGIAAGIMAGFYPSVTLSRAQPLVVLKGNTKTVAEQSLPQKISVSVQFIVSIALIIATLIVHRQMHFMKHSDLGFRKDNVILLTIRNPMTSNVDSFRNEILKDNRVMQVATSSNFPGEGDYSADRFNRDGSDEKYDFIYMHCGFDFIETYEIEVIHGRSFSNQFVSDLGNGVILNETAVRELGFPVENAIGKRLTMGRGNQVREFDIVGIVKDYHFKTLKREIQPLVLILQPEALNYISIHIDGEDIGGTLDTIREKWTAQFPGIQFEHQFIDVILKSHYAHELRIQDLFVLFSSLSIVIAGMGLVGFISLIVEAKTKEIGIRKVLGASALSIGKNLFHDFALRILVANSFAWPLTYFFMTRWLQNFPYRISIQWDVFAIAGAISILVTFLSVGHRVFHAAVTNPVEVLKYE